MPATLVGICLLLALFVKKRPWKKAFLITGVVLFFLFTNDFIINQILLSWEIPPTSFDDVTKNYDVGIVLTGITNLQIEPKDRVYFNKGADRIIHAVALYKQGKIGTILISGGTGSLSAPEITEANELKKVLDLYGIPEADIIIENESRNTYENAVNTAKILRARYPEGEFLLITSAFHLRRAKACFDKTGLKTTSFSTDFYTHPTTYTPDSLLIPNESAIYHWLIFEREILGILMYKLAGYI